MIWQMHLQSVQEARTHSAIYAGGSDLGSGLFSRVILGEIKCCIF